MANTSRTIKVIFDGSVEGIRTAAASAKEAIRGVGDENNALTKSLKDAEGFTAFTSGLAGIIAKAGAGAAVIQAVASTGVVLTQTLITLAPAILVLPGILLGAGAAFATFKLATDGVSDALKGQAGALQKLSPQAQAAVKAVLAFKTQFDALKKSVQDNFFQGFADQIKQTGSVLLPILSKQLPVIASGFNGIGTAAIAAARTPFFTDAVTKILANTGTAIANLKTSVADALTGFVGLGTVGAQYLPRIATAIDNVAARFSAWVQSGLQSGSIQTFVDGAIAAFKQLGTIISNIGSILKEVFTGLNAGLGAGGALSGIIATTQAVKEFLATAQAQDALKSLGTAIKALGDAFRGVLLEALKQVAPILVALVPFLVALASTLGTTLVTALQLAGPLLTQLAAFLSSNAGAAAIFVTGLLGLGAAISVIGTVVSAIEGVVAAFGVVSGVVGTVVGVFSEVGSAIAGAVGFIVGELGGLTAIGSAIGSVFAGIGAVVTAPITLIVAAVAAIIAAFVLAYNKIAAFRDFVDSALAAVGTAVSSVGTFFAGLPAAIGSAVAGIPAFFSGLVTSIVGFFTGLPAQIGSIFSSIGSAISTAFVAVVGFIVGIPGQIVSVFTSIGATASAFFAALPSYAFEAGVAIGVAIGQILNFFINLWNSVVTATSTAFTTIVAFVVGLPAQVGAAITALGAAISAGATAAWNFLVTATTTAVTSTIAFVTSLPSKVGAALSSLGSTLTSLATSAWNSFKTTTTTLITAAIAYVKTVPTLITSALTALAGILKTAATTGWTAFTTAIKTAATATLAYVKSVPGLIVSAIGNLGSLLVAAGKALIDGLLAGIKAGYNAMLSFVKGIAAGIAAVKGPLPYDRIILIPAGLAIMEGLLNGLKTGHANVLDFVSTIAASVQGKVQAGVQSGLGTIVPGADASLSVVHTINNKQNAPDMTQVIGSAIQAGLAQAPAPVTNVHVDPKIDALTNFINVSVEQIHREVARVVGQGAAVQFGGM